MKKIKINSGQPYPLGASVREAGINFSMVNASDKECGIIFYRKGIEQKERIIFDQKHRIGNICCALVEGINASDCEYNFFIGDEVFVDPYAKKIAGNEKWRSGEFVRPLLRGGFDGGVYDWQDTAPLHIPYHESIMYCLNVRSFTRHPSSKVKKKGTFEGLMEKIPYLKELGINAVELMPAYEYEECEWDSTDVTTKTQIEYQVNHIDEELPLDEEPQRARRLNCWGYKEAFYFAPKASYAAGDNPCEAFRRMVRELHKNGIEVIMQFYFPDDVKQGYILEIIKYWVLAYQIDGVHLKGSRLPMTLIATEPLLANTKILCEDFYLHEIYPNDTKPHSKVLGYYRDEYMYDMRKYLKGDQDMLKSFLHHMRNTNPQCGVVNYITNYYGFTLNDLVSYEKKHNEPNGENNTDGTDYNFSWNCGVEGPSRKKAINQLRHKQIKNALSFLFTAQGTPLLYAGDEFGNSQDGNNNCYCQDNETGWVDWRGLARNQDLFTYVRELIAFRKQHSILHLDDGLTTLDRYGYGYPDLSYHAEEAWKAQRENYSRHIGILYCGQNDARESDYIYIAYNMHWNSHRFALPSIANHKWVSALSTEANSIVYDEEKNMEYIDAAPRSVSILIGKKLTEAERKQKAAMQNKKVTSLPESDAANPVMKRSQKR
ncbi:MAG: alpha-amylase family glycosyl hydrolase [Muribaculaceae bacterium]|nr:alpha-amylase family glycosyl hydrolase [Muribaculaceae bacterium]